jgi:hypothetical protein
MGRPEPGLEVASERDLYSKGVVFSVGVKAIAIALKRVHVDAWVCGTVLREHRGYRGSIWRLPAGQNLPLSRRFYLRLSGRSLGIYEEDSEHLKFPNRASASCCATSTSGIYRTRRC